MSSKEEIVSILEAFASTERMGSFFLDNATPDFLFIRPSGNPIDAKGFQEMWSSGDLVLGTQKLQRCTNLNFKVQMLQCAYSP